MSDRVQLKDSDRFQNVTHRRVKQKDRIPDIVEKLDQALIMEGQQLGDDERKIYLEIERFFDEYNLEDEPSVDDIREGIIEIKDLIKRYENKHIDLRRLLGEEEHDKTYAGCRQVVNKMTTWVKAARKKVTQLNEAEKLALSEKIKVERDQELGNQKEEKRSELKTEEKYLNIKMEQFLFTIDIDSAEFVDEVENNLFVVNDLLNKLVDLHKKLETSFGNDYAKEFQDEFDAKKKKLTEQITCGKRKIKDLKHQEVGVLIDKEKAEEKKNYDDKVTLSDHILDDIETRSQMLAKTFDLNFDDLTDEKVEERKKNWFQVEKDFNKILDKITELVKETPTAYEDASGVIASAKKTRDKLQALKVKYLEDLDAEVLKRDIGDNKKQSRAILKIQLPKFRGYDSSVDIYTFKSDFEKLIAPEIQRKHQAEYLKKQYLEGQALLLVKEIQSLEEIWEKLLSSFGCTMQLLQNKLSEVRNFGQISKIKEKEKLLSVVSMLVNGMIEVQNLAEKHSIKDQLYHHTYISMIYDIIGSQRKEKFLYKHAGLKMSCEERWIKIVGFLKVEIQVLESLVLDEKTKLCQNVGEQKAKTSNESQRSSHHSNIERPCCLLCGKNDHVSITSRKGKEIIHYFACDKFANAKNSERFQMLKTKELCFQCLYPGLKKNHDGNCVDQFACKHSSHRRFNKSKHILVCEEHKDDQENVRLFEKYKKRFITDNTKVSYEQFTKDLKLVYLVEPVPNNVDAHHNESYAVAPADKDGPKKEVSIFMLQTILVDGELFNLFYDGGCGDLLTRKGAVDKLLKMGRARNITPGPLGLSGVSGMQAVCPHGEYEITLPLHDGEEYKMSGLCMDVVTSEFPRFPLAEVEMELQDEYGKLGSSSLDLPKLPAVVGGATDIMMGIGYRDKFPRLVYELPCGLGLYKSAFVSADGTRGVVAGPHYLFTEFLKRSRVANMNMQSYYSEMVLAYKQSYRIGMHVPLLGTGKPGIDIDRTNTVVTPTRWSDAVATVNHAMDIFEEVEDAGTCFVDECSRCRGCPCYVYLMRRFKVDAERFDEAENAGTDISYRCVKCRDCPDCKMGAKVEESSIIEEVQQDLINRSVEVDLENCVTKADLPFIKRPENRLSSNQPIAMKVYKHQVRALNKKPKDKEDTIQSEKKLHTLGFVDWLENLSREEKSMILNSEIQHFIPWRVVWNLNSLTTPCRLVFDASMKANSEYCLNDLLAKGRNNMNKLVEIMIRWRTRLFAYHTDVQKMYNTIRLNPQYWCYQLYLWNDSLDPDKTPAWKVIKTLMYGVRSSGNQAERGLRLTAELQKEEYPRVNEVVQEDIYVDDCASGENTFEDRNRVTKDLNAVLKRGGFKLKGITLSGSDPPEHLTEDGMSMNVGGMRYFSKQDELAFNLSELNFAKKKRGKKSTGDVGVIPEKLTRADCVGKVAEVFDLNGLLTPITAGWKVDLTMFRKMDWEVTIPDELRKIWVDNFDVMKEIHNLRFDRAIVPVDAASLDIETIDFGDASTVLICSAIYARFKRKNGEFSCQLVFARSKIVPDDTTIPRAELSAAVLNARTSFIVQRSFGKYFKQCVKLTDGQIALHWIHNHKLRLKQWPRNRVIEIIRLSSLKDWKYVSTENMLADLGTRKGATIQDVGRDSVWVNGYPWMKMTSDNFPIKTIEEVKLNAEEKKLFDKECLESNDYLYGYNNSYFYALTNEAYSSMKIDPVVMKQRYEYCRYVIDPNKFRFRTVVRILALVMLFIRNIQKKRGKNVNKPIECCVPSAFQFKYDQHLVTLDDPKSGLRCKAGLVVSLTNEDIALALDYFYRKSTEEVKKFLHKKVYRNITKEVNGILYYSGRILASQEFNGKINLSDVCLDLTATTFCVPVMDCMSPVAHSVASEIHWHDTDACHSGVETLLRYTQKVSYIIGGRELVKKYKKDCVRCRLLAKKTLELAMGAVHPSQFNIAPAFFHTQVDIFGPLKSYSNANKRATIKIWFVVFCCCTTGAVAMKTMEDYTTEQFILGFIRFATSYGYPKKLMPDEGSQLVKGCKVMELEYYDIKHRLHRDFGIDFETCPVGAHNEHGRVERKIRHIQESFMKVTENSRLSVLQWETVGDQIANSVNNHPIAVGNIVDEVENLDILTPNRLMIGRNNDRSPTGNFEVTSDPRRIIQSNTDIFNAWFEAWLISYVPQLIKQPKWFKSERDVKIGDIVLFLKTDGELAKQYQYGLVKEVTVGRDGKIRKVEIEYQNHTESVKRVTLRSTRDIVMIHPVDEIGIELQIGTVAKSCGY